MKGKKILTSFLVCNTFALPLALVGLPKHDNKTVSVSNVVKAIPQPKSEVVKLSKQPETLADYNKADPKSIATLEKFDTREYKIITPIKDQRNEGLCWAYATAGTAEASILKEGLSDDKTITFSPHGIDYITNKRKPEFDPLGNNPMDEWGGSSGAGASQVWAMNALQMWTGPLDQKKYGDNYVQHKPDYFLENAGLLALPQDTPLDEKIQKTKEMVAEYGSVTIDVLMPPHNPGYINTNFKDSRYVGHAIDIIGWDDTIDKNLYNNGRNPAARNGGWLVKNSWGPSAGPKYDGTAYISYDSHLGAMIGLDFDKANNKYDNNYYYDAKSDDGLIPEESVGKQVAAIFKAKKANFNTKEVLKAVNVGIETPDTTIDIKVYKGVSADFDDPKSTTNNPISNNLVAHETKYSKYAGYTTIDLTNEIVLERDEVFSIVVSLSNGGRLYYSNDHSTDNMTFYEQSPGRWVNPLQNIGGAAARIKAFTKEIEIPNVTSHSLKDARVEMSSQISRIGEPEPTVKSVSIGGKKLTTDNYTIEMDPIKFTMTSSNISSLDDVVGNRIIKIKGKAPYTDEFEVKHLYRVGKLPDLNKKAWYENEQDPLNATLNLRVKESSTRYKDIDLPEHFQWIGDENSSISIDNPLALEYRGDNYEFYRKYRFHGRNLKLTRVPDNNFKPIPDNIDKPSKPSTPTPPSYSPDPPEDDPQFNVKHAKIKLDRYEYTYEGHPIEPQLVDLEDGAHVHPMLHQFLVSYEDNNKPGIGKVIVRGNYEKTMYFGEQVVEFTIKDKDGNVPKPQPTPSFETLKINIDNQGKFTEGDTISASATVNGEHLDNVEYKWEILDSTTSLSSTTNSVSFKADYKDSGKRLKVTATCGGKSISEEVTLTIKKKEIPLPEPILGTVSISIDNRRYRIGEIIRADANVTTRSLSNVHYSWTIDGNPIGSDSNTISFEAKPEYDNKTLKLEVRHNGNVETSTTLLSVEQPASQTQPEPLPPFVEDTPNNSITPPSNNNGGSSNSSNGTSVNSIDTQLNNSNGFDWWIYGLVGLGALLILIGIMVAIIHSKKKAKTKHKSQPKMNMYQRPVNTEIKTIPVRTSSGTNNTYSNQPQFSDIRKQD